MTPSDLHRAIDSVWKAESARVIGAVARITRDVALAEDLAQDALVAALEQWPASGIPSNPGAWLTAAAKNRAIDRLRHQQLALRKQAALGRQIDENQPDPAATLDAAIDNPVDDDILRLIFVACHPVLTPEARAALTLRMLGGLTTHEIARAFLAAEPAIAQRIVRAKRTLSEANVPFEVPPARDLAARTESVLEVLYLIFNEGYSATAGDDWMRPALCEEALRLGRLLADLTPHDAEVHGLFALMQLQASRAKARTGPDGQPVLLADQDRSRWDGGLIRGGLASLERAMAISPQPGPYALQATIAAVHARAASPEETDWPAIVAAYDALARAAPSPVVELNRAVALAMAFGPAAGLASADALLSEPALAHYHLLPAVRGDFLWKLGRLEEARAEFVRAASLTQNARERDLLLGRARQ